MNDKDKEFIQDDIEKFVKYIVANMSETDKKEFLRLCMKLNKKNENESEDIY